MLLQSFLLALLGAVAVAAAKNSTGIGAYIAAGLGASSSGSETTGTVSTSSVSLSNTTESAASTRLESDAQASSPSANVDSYATTSFSYASTASPSATITYLWSNLSMVALTGTNANHSVSTFSLDPAAPCWSQWDQYWSASSINENQALEIQVPITTVETYYNNSAVVGTYTSMTSTFGTATYTELTVLSDGNYAYSTSSSTTTTTVTLAGSFYMEISTDSADYEYYSTSTYSQYSSICKPYANVYKPNCTLGSYVPECQSRWSTWIVSASDYSVSKYSKPSCTNADITGSLCTSLVSAFLSDRHYSSLGPITSSIPWPTHTTFAPGRTLSCQTCAITGDKVQLLYWPPVTSATFIDGNSSQVVAPTEPPSNKTVVVSYGGTQLTSPTIYISYHLLYASDSCGPIGPSIRDTIVPLTKSADLASIQWNYLDFNNQWMTESFNFTDLIEPIPQSIYNKQPSCAAQAVSWVQYSPATASGLSQLASWSGSGTAWWSVTSNYDCPRTSPYAPIIAVPIEARNFAPEWSSCTVWYGGLYDPPKALQSQSAAAKPTMPATYTTMPASPSSAMQNTQPSQTAGPKQTSILPAYGTSTGIKSTSQSAAAPASYGSSSVDAGSTWSEPTSTSQDAGGAIMSVLTGGSAATGSQYPTQTVSVVDPPVSSASESATRSSSVIGDPSDPATAYGDLATPEASSADPGQGSAVPTVTSEQQSTAGTVPTAAGNSNTLSGSPSQSAVAVVGSATLQPGQATTIDNKQYSVDSEGGVIVGGATSAPQNAVSVLSSVEQSAAQEADPGATDPGASPTTTPGALATGVIITGNGRTVTAVQTQPGSYAVDSTTITPGQIATLSNGQVISAGSSPLAVDGSSVAVTALTSPAPDSSGVFVTGGETISLPVIETLPSASGVAVLTEDGTQVTAYQAPGQTNVAVVNDSTLSVGGAGLTLDEGAVVVSLASNGLVHASQTAAFSAITSSVLSGSGQLVAVFTQGQTYAATQAVGSSNAAVVDGTTLSVSGPALTLSGGNAVSLGSSGLVEGGTTVAFSTIAAASQGSSAVTTSAAVGRSSTSLPSLPPASTSAHSGAGTVPYRLLPMLTTTGAVLLIMLS